MSRTAAGKALLGLYLRRHGVARVVLWTSTGLVLAIWLAAFTLYSGALQKAEGALSSLGGDEVRFLSPKPIALFGLDLSNFGREPMGLKTISDLNKAFPGQVDLVQVPASDIQVQAELFGQHLRSEVALLVLPDEMLPPPAKKADAIPFYLPRTLVELFNQAYAPSKGLPGVDEGALKKAEYQLAINHRWHPAELAAVVDALPLPAPAVPLSRWQEMAPDVPLKTVLIRVRLDGERSTQVQLEKLAGIHGLQVVDPAKERAKIREAFAPLMQGASFLLLLLLLAQAGALVLLWRQEISQEKIHMQLLKALGMSRAGLLLLSLVEGLLWGILLLAVGLGSRLLLLAVLKDRIPLLAGLQGGGAMVLIPAALGLLLLPALLETIRALLASRKTDRISL